MMEKDAQDFRISGAEKSENLWSVSVTDAVRGSRLVLKEEQYR